RIEDMAHPPSLEHESDTLVEHEAAELERRKRECISEPELRIRDDRKRHALALRELDLRRKGLRGQPCDPGAELGKLGGVIAKGARLRRASACPRNRVPTVGSRSSGSTGGRIDVEDCELRTE